MRKMNVYKSEKQKHQYFNNLFKGIKIHLGLSLAQNKSDHKQTYCVKSKRLNLQKGTLLTYLLKATTQLQ